MADPHHLSCSQLLGLWTYQLAAFLASDYVVVGSQHPGPALLAVIDPSNTLWCSWASALFTASSVLHFWLVLILMLACEIFRFLSCNIFLVQLTLSSSLSPLTGSVSLFLLLYNAMLVRLLGSPSHLHHLYKASGSDTAEHLALNTNQRDGFKLADVLSVLLFGFNFAVNWIYLSFWLLVGQNIWSHHITLLLLGPKRTVSTPLPRPLAICSYWYWVK